MKFTMFFDLGIAKLQAMKACKPSPSLGKKILIIAMIVLVVGIYLSVYSNPGLLSNIDWQFIAVVMLIGVPLTTFMNALEFMLSARMVNVKFPVLRALKISIIGSAANMLPLPGATIVRVAALKTAGVTLGKGSGVTILVGLIWVGVAFCYASLMLLEFKGGVIVWILCLVGVFLILFCGFVTYFSRLGVVNYLFLIILKLAMELVSAGLAPLVGIAVSAGFLSATLNRIAGLVVLLPISGLVLWLGKKK